MIATSRGAADKSKRPPTPPDPQWRVSQFESGPDVASAPRADLEPNPERRFEGKVLVTGGAGHLGANMVRRLLDDGMDVRVLVRPGSDNSAVEGLPVELVLGDLRDAASVARAVQGCETIYHCAANVSTVQASAELEREIFECNVLGTKNLLQSARSASVERVVVTGSFSGIGYDLEDRSKAGNEEMPFYPFEDVLPYARTKMQAEHESLKACVEGLDVVIATSCAIIGPHDYKPSRMGRTMLDYAHGRLHAYIAGGFDFVSTRDLTEGHVLAMRRGRKGQKYIVSTEYQSLDDIMATWEEITGRPRPRVRLPADAMAGVAKVSSFVLGNFFPESPQRFTPAAVRILKKERRADTSKAQRELGYRPTSVRHAFHEAYEDFARRGLVPGRSRIHVSVPVHADEAESKSPRKTPSSASRAATGS